MCLGQVQQQRLTIRVWHDRFAKLDWKHRTRVLQAVSLESRWMLTKIRFVVMFERFA